METSLVIEIPKTTSEVCRDWLISKLRSSKISGGCEIEASAAPPSEDGTILVHTRCPVERLLETGEYVKIRKVYKDKSMREVTIEDIKNFEGGDELETFFTRSEQQRLLSHIIQHMRAQPEDSSVPGSKTTLMHGESIVIRMMYDGLISQVFPLHDKEELRRFSIEWYSWKTAFSFQPLDHIREYYGEQLALYFAFLGFYTLALLPPSLIGLIYWITGWTSVYRNIFFAVFNLIWCTLFLELWKRSSAELSYKWGCVNVRRREVPRAGFYGEERISRVTGKPELHYSKKLRALKYYCVSAPVMVLFMLFAYWLMIVDIGLELDVENRYAEDPSFWNHVLLYVPSTVYALIVAVLNVIYRRIAEVLTDWENHRLESTYENHLIFKLIMFYTVNCFISLFYIAFYMQDMARLRMYLASLLLVSQILDQFIETIIPYFYIRIMQKDARKRLKGQSPEKELAFGTFPSNFSLKQALYERGMDPFKGTLDDMLELYIQFGYVFLFSAAFPSAAIWALVNNVTEIRMDAFKMCRNFQRPISRPAENIGAWQTAFELVGLLAVITNSALIAMSPRVQLMCEWMNSTQYLLLFVVVEHVLIALREALMRIVPDRPAWIQTELDRIEYQAAQALKAQEMMQAKAAVKQSSV